MDRAFPLTARVPSRAAASQPASKTDLEAHMALLTGDPDITPITSLINTWIHIGQALGWIRRRAGFYVRVPVDTVKEASGDDSRLGAEPGSS